MDESFCDFPSDGWRDEVLLRKMDKKSWMKS
jgi:hypothetical protein